MLLSIWTSANLIRICSGTSQNQSRSLQQVNYCHSTFKCMWSILLLHRHNLMTLSFNTIISYRINLKRPTHFNVVLFGYNSHSRHRPLLSQHLLYLSPGYSSLCVEGTAGLCKLSRTEKGGEGWGGAKQYDWKNVCPSILVTHAERQFWTNFCLTWGWPEVLAIVVSNFWPELFFLCRSCRIE